MYLVKVYNSTCAKHILSKIFFTHDLQRNGDVEIQKIRLCENLIDLFTKPLPRKTFE